MSLWSTPGFVDELSFTQLLEEGEVLARERAGERERGEVDGREERRAGESMQLWLRWGRRWTGEWRGRRESEMER